MTTVAYASVSRSGLSFDAQLWMREEIVPELRKLTDAIHAEGAKASIQLGHCGNMTHRSTCGCTPSGPRRVSTSTPPPSCADCARTRCSASPTTSAMP